MEADRETRAQRRDRITPAVVRALLRNHPDRGQVMFTSGEPTLHPLLPEFIGIAREEGYASIALTSNGRRLAYAPYARELVERGLRRFVFSIHGADRRHHDSQTRTPGSFAQALAGLRTVVALKVSHPLTIHTSTVVSRRNVDRLTDVYRLLASFPVDQIVFNVVKPDGRAAALFDALVPRYADVRGALESLLADQPGAARRLFVIDMPPCMTEGLPDRIRGFAETYTYFEAEDDTPDKPSARNVRTVDGGRILVSDRTVACTPLVHGPPCARCRARRRCDGVWTQYIERFGWDEFGLAPRRKR